MDLKIKEEHWDKENQKVITCEESEDYNLILKQIESRITNIKVQHRLSEIPLTMEKFREVKSNVCPTIPARARQDGSGQPIIGAFRGRNPDNPNDRGSGIYLEQRLEINQDNISNTLSSVQKDNVVVGSSNIRRFTEIECERLQGFPDDWTMYGIYDGVVKKISKTQRYGMLGNAVTVNVVCEVAKRLLKINSE